MDLVYTLRKDALAGNTQLRYSLRSVEKHLKNYGRIFVIGAEPALNNVTHIPYEDYASSSHNAAHNIAEKLVLASKHPEISQRFMYIADDHYFIQDVDAETYPYYSNGSLRDLIKLQAGGYANTLKNTERVLREKGYATHNFNIHCPVIYDKEKVQEVYGLFNWPGHGYVFKSLYGNVLGLYDADAVMKDCKICHDRGYHTFMERLKGRHVFSTGNEYRWPQIMQILKEHFPQKSSYE